MQTLIIFISIIAFIATLVLWYTIKERLKENEYEVDFFFHHLNDIPNFIKLISKEQTSDKKKKYINLITAFAISLISLIISVVVLLIGYNQ
jgi:Na+/melibiose symporter-like transporter